MLKKILNHSFWLLIGNSIGRLSMFMTNIVAARLLSQETFGQFMMIRSTITSVEGILSGALGSPIIKRVSEISHEDRATLNKIISALFFTNLIIAVILAVILYIFSPLLVEHFFIGESLMVHGLEIGVLLLITTTLSNSMQSILTGFEEFKKLAFAGISASIVSFPIIVGLIYYFGFSGAIWGVVLYFMSDFVWKCLQMRKILSLSWGNGLSSISEESKKLLQFSTPLFLSVVVTSLSFWYARVIVIESTGSFKDIAIFDAAYQWLTIIMIITGATTSVALPMLSKAFGNNNKTALKSILVINIGVNLGISIIMAILFAFFSKQIMSLYGTDYISGNTVLMILSAVSVFFTLSSLLNKYILVKNKPWMIFYSSLGGAIALFSTLCINSVHAEIALAGSFLAFYLTGSFLYLGFIWSMK